MNRKEAILDVARGGPAEFTAEELVVAAWRRDPLRFGLSGYERLYPDSNRVLREVHGKRGLVAGGELERVARGRYRVAKGGGANGHQ